MRFPLVEVSSELPIDPLHDPPTHTGPPDVVGHEAMGEPGVPAFRGLMTGIAAGIDVDHFAQ